MKSKNWGFLILGAVIINVFIITNMYLMNINCVNKSELYCASKSAEIYKLLIPSTIFGLAMSIYLIKRKEK